MGPELPHLAVFGEQSCEILSIFGPHMQSTKTHAMEDLLITGALEQHLRAVKGIHLLGYG